MKPKRNPHLGSDFDDFLRQDGIFEAVEAAAMKKLIASALAPQMKRRHISVSRFAAALGTSRAAVNRILEEGNTSITLTTLTRAGALLGCKVKLELIADCKVHGTNSGKKAQRKIDLTPGRVVIGAAANAPLLTRDSVQAALYGRSPRMILLLKFSSAANRSMEYDWQFPLIPMVSSRP